MTCWICMKNIAQIIRRNLTSAMNQINCEELRHKIAHNIFIEVQDFINFEMNHFGKCCIDPNEFQIRVVAPDPGSVDIEACNSYTQGILAEMSGYDMLTRPF